MSKQSAGNCDMQPYSWSVSFTVKKKHALVLLALAAVSSMWQLLILATNVPLNSISSLTSIGRDDQLFLCTTAIQ